MWIRVNELSCVFCLVIQVMLHLKKNNIKHEHSVLVAIYSLVSDVNWLTLRKCLRFRLEYDIVQ